MQKEPEISSKQPSSVCYVVGGESVVVPTSATKSIAWDNRQLRLQVMPNPGQIVQGLLLGSSYRRLDSSNDKEVPLQILDAGAQVVVGESFADVKRFGLAVADGSGGHYGDPQQDRKIADVAKLCSQLALSELNRYSDPDKCYAALPTIVKTLAAAAKTQGLTESCSFSAMLAFVGKDEMTVVGLGIGDCLLASLELNSGRIETICPAHESAHGAAMFPQGYHEVELRYFQKRLPKNSILLGFTDGLWAGLPHVKLAKTYATGLTYQKIKLDSHALAPLLLPQHTHGLGAVAYDILVQHALQTIETKRAQAKQHWDSATQAKAALPSLNSEAERNLDLAIKLRDDGIPYTSVHSGDDSLGQMVQLQSLQTYCLETLIELLPENVKRLAEMALRSPYATWHEPLSLLIQKEIPGSFVWTFGLCLLSQGLMQKANRDNYLETYVAGLKYAAAALKGATCLTGQLLAGTQLQTLLQIYATKELGSDLKNKLPIVVDIGLRPFQLQQHRQYLRQRLHQKTVINELIKYNHDFLISFVVNQWQDLLENISDASLKEWITLLALGSVGRGEPAPYSDFEFGWLITKTLAVKKQRLLIKLTEWWYLQVVALGETKTYLSQSDRKPFVKAGFTFDMDLGGLSPLMNDRLINTPEGLAGLQEKIDNSDLILRNALISCSYLWGSKKLYDEYQTLLAQRLNQPSDQSITKGLLGKKLKRSQTHALSLLEAALTEFAPSSLNTLKERKQALGFKVKDELYRLGSQALTGLCWYYQYYQPGGFHQLQWLQDHKKLHSDARGHIQQVFEEALHWRYRAQLFYGYENESLFPASVLDESSNQEPHYQLTATEVKNIHELYRTLLPLEQAMQQFLRDKRDRKKSTAFTTKGLYSSDEVTLVIAQARMGNYHEAEKYYQVMTLNTHDPYLYLLRLQNLGQRYEQLRAILREQKYLTSLKATNSQAAITKNSEKPFANSSSLSQLEKEIQELKGKAQDIIQQLLLKIVLSQKQLSQQLETLYRQLPFVFRESFRIALLKINDQHPNYKSVLQPTLTALHRHPDVASERLRWQEQKQQWQAALRQCIDDQKSASYQGKYILLHSTLLGQRPLAAFIAEQLLEEGEFKNQHIGGGIHRVIRLRLSEEQALYAKAYPEMPGMTYLIEQLHVRLLGHGVGLSELVRLEVPKKGSLPVLLSYEVKGPTLDAVLRGEPHALNAIQVTTVAEALDRLDRHRVMGLMLLAMLTNPEDGIPTNFIYHLTPDNKATLVSIDHDHALFPSYLGEELQVKTILFCLPLLKEKLPESLKRDILALEAGNELRAVLRDAQAQNIAYRGLFDDEMMKTWHQQRKGGATTIPIPIKKGDATKLYFKLIRLQELIKDKPELTGLACLQVLEPRVGTVYAKALQEDKNPQQRLQEIGRYMADKRGALLSNTVAFKTLQITSSSLSQPAYAKLQDLSPEEGLTELDIIAYQSELIADIQQEIYQGNFIRFQQVLQPIHQAQVISGEPRRRLKPLHWKSLSKDQQQSILDIGKDLTFEHLDLNQCDVLTDIQLALLLSQSPDLVSLTLSEYSGFSDKTLRLVSKACPSLERLVLRDLVSWTGDVLKQPLIFPVLKELQLHQGKKLSSFLLQCPQLENLLLDECTELSAQHLSRKLAVLPSLQRVHLRRFSTIFRQELRYYLLRARGIKPNTLGLSDSLIENNKLNLAELQPTLSELTMLMHYYPTLQGIILPDTNLPLLYSIAIDILTNKLPSIPLTLIQRDYDWNLHIKDLKGHQEAITTLAMLRDDHVVSGSADGTLRIWDLSESGNETCIRILRGHKGIFILAVLPGNRIASGSDDTIKIWDLTYADEKACRYTIHDRDLKITALAALPDGRLVSAYTGNTIKVWDITQADKQAYKIFTSTFDIRLPLLWVLPDGRVVRGKPIPLGDDSWNNVMELWDFKPSEEKKLPQVIPCGQHNIQALAVLPNDCVVTGSNDGSMKIWDLARPHEDACIKTFYAGKDSINALATLPDGRMMICSYAFMRALYLTNYPEGDGILLHLQEYTNTKLLILSDGRLVSTTWESESLKVWYFNEDTKVFRWHALQLLTQKIDLQLNESHINIKLSANIDIVETLVPVLAHLHDCLLLIFRWGIRIKKNETSGELSVTVETKYAYGRLVHLLLCLRPSSITGLLPKDIRNDELNYRLQHYNFMQPEIQEPNILAMAKSTLSQGMPSARLILEHSNLWKQSQQLVVQSEDDAPDPIVTSKIH